MEYESEKLEMAEYIADGFVNVLEELSDRRSGKIERSNMDIALDAMIAFANYNHASKEVREMTNDLRIADRSDTLVTEATVEDYIGTLNLLTDRCLGEVTFD